MGKITLATLALLGCLTGAAYLYLPSDSPTTPPVAATQEPPPPLPGENRRYRGRKQPPQTFVPLGIMAFGCLWLKAISD